MEKTVVKKWFMIHTYSGYEKKVKTDLENKIETLNIGGIVTKVLVPEEKTVEEVRGKMKTVARKLFPGYVMLEMVATKEESNEGINYKVDSNAWYVVRNTNGGTGFVGVGSDPIPKEDEEVRHIFDLIGYDIPEEEQQIREVVKIDFTVGDYVKILDESFAGQEGKVVEIDTEQKKVKVMIEMFGRMTPAELDFDNVQKA